MSNIVIKTPKLDRIREKLERVDDFVQEVADETEAMLRRNWEKGLGGNGRPMKDLTKDYIRRKEEERGDGFNKPDMVFSGDTLKTLGVSKEKENERIIGFRTAEAANVAKHYVKRRPNLMTLSREWRKKIRDYIFGEVMGR